MQILLEGSQSLITLARILKIVATQGRTHKCKAYYYAASMHQISRTGTYLAHYVVTHIIHLDVTLFLSLYWVESLVINF